MGAALLLRNRRTLLVLSVAALAAAVVLIGAAIVFMRDFHRLGAAAAPAVRAAAWQALVCAALAVPVVSWMGIGGWMAVRAAEPRPVAERRDRANLVGGS